MLFTKLFAQELSTLVIKSLGGRVMAEIRLQSGIGDQAGRIRGVVDSRLAAQDGESLFEQGLGLGVLADALVRSGEVDAQRTVFFAEIVGRRLRFVNRASFLDRAIARSYSPTRTRYLRACSGSRQRADLLRLARGNGSDCVFGQGLAFRQLGRVAAQQRQIVGAFRVVGRVDSKIRLTQLEGLPQVGLTVFLISGGVFEESQAVHAAGGLFGAGSGGQGQTGDPNRLF